ncbi:hypothetical protein VPH35_035980 [Triticum aestivum]|uniref:Anaphase-promoting complex subunit 4 WD40 domain-containing protein n=1 Tax=Aegilops tauschii subsp. strangulata TaxID=200361 RepID=A0A453B5C4_AEGTS
MMMNAMRMAESTIFFRTTMSLLSRVPLSFLPGMLDFSRLVDANAQEPSTGPINSVQFHRNGQLMLAAGLDKHLRFFQIDGERNPKIQSIFIQDPPQKKNYRGLSGLQGILST